MNHADGTAPIYAELIRERGDVPGDVRQVAEDVLRDLSRVIPVPPQGAQGPQGAVAHGGQVAHAGAVAHGGPAGHPGVGGPMGVGGPSGVVGQAGAVLPHRPMR
ncbi:MULTISPECIES: hypothetical protein [Streptomyces]|nr:hypothetical protein [Streptomyces venezuelae]APE19711.1 hypothetical protein vnz_00990 [Streptomyces venezuelae]QER97121.1 hypothetical protein DEJ43_01005 [Streptomyces venezuelae ATCC 10712]QES04311.1 hypothetical protein DEJ44_00970 [Streptomyces venezuelae]QES16947.1 hypothetical protein DEJ45_34260 [Streptomyces venezuelae]